MFQDLGIYMPSDRMIGRHSGGMSNGNSVDLFGRPMNGSGPSSTGNGSMGDMFGPLPSPPYMGMYILFRIYWFTLAFLYQTTQ